MAKQKLYIMHGWTYSLDKWDEILAVLKKQNIEPVLLRVPGLSEPSDEVWDVDKYVGWLRDKLQDEKAPLLVGHSNGGRVGMAYDAKYPNHLQKLFLLASAGVPREEATLSWKRRISKPLAALLKPIVGTRVRRKLYRIIGASDYGNAAPNMQETMKLLWKHDASFDPSTVSAPTTLIWGEQDSSTPIADAHTLSQAIPNVDGLHILHGAGHSPQADDAEQVAMIIVDAIEGKQ